MYKFQKMSNNKYEQKIYDKINHNTLKSKSALCGIRMNKEDLNLVLKSKKMDTLIKIRFIYAIFRHRAQLIMTKNIINLTHPKHYLRRQI